MAPNPRRSAVNSVRSRRVAGATPDDGTLRRAAAPGLWAGEPLAAVAEALGVSPAALVAAHATPFDREESPLKARWLTDAPAVMRTVLDAQVTLHAAWPGLQARVHGAGVTLRSTQTHHAFAVQRCGQAAEVMWFDGAGHGSWTWTVAPAHAPLHDALVHTRGGLALRPDDMATWWHRSAVPRTVAGAVASRLPPGAAWDLLLQAAAHRLHIGVQMVCATTLVWEGVPRRVQLQGQVLRVEAGPMTVCLSEDAPVYAQALAPAEWAHTADQALYLGPGHNATRAQACAWGRLMAAVCQDQRLTACGC